MAMTKIVDPRGWDFERPVAQMIKVGSRGLVGQDRTDFIKLAGDSASTHVFLNALDNLKIAKDEVPLHLIALGASEAYGPNRNGDGFKEATCREYHHTFVKFARWYRNHKNKDPKESFGKIAASAYNEQMRRVELLAILNGEKSAAERNGGHVADKELEKLAKGDDIPVSMACRVAFDKCSNCGNEAPSREQYCTEDKCVGPRGEKRGGCKHNLTKIGHDGHILHVDNPRPHWFDMSHVYRPADRIAYGARADWLAKAASHDFVPGAEAAEMLDVTAPLQVLLAQDDPMGFSTATVGQLKLAAALALAEQQELSEADRRACDPRTFDRLTDAQLALLGTPGTTKAAEALAALADAKVILSLDEFAHWLGKRAAASAAAQWLPDVYQRLAEHGDLEARLSRNRFALPVKTASAAQRALAQNIAKTNGLTKAAAVTRSMRSCLRGLPAPAPVTGCRSEKRAADAPEITALAEEYALYKLAALHRIAGFDQDFVLTARLAIGQNKV